MAFDPARVRALLFDIDGTLADTDDRWVQRFESHLSAVHWVFPKGNAHPFARWLVMALESPGNLALGLLDTLGLDDDFERLRKLREKRAKRDFLLIPRVDSMLKSLEARFPLAVVSARDETGSNAFLDQFALRHFFQTVVTSQTCEYTKPHPHPVRWAADQLGVSPQECVMIGDTTVDIRAGKAAGAQTVGVLCGFGTERELRRAGADLILKDTADLAEILMK